MTKLHLERLVSIPNLEAGRSHPLITPGVMSCPRRRPLSLKPHLPPLLPLFLRTRLPAPRRQSLAALYLSLMRREHRHGLCCSNVATVKLCLYCWGPPLSRNKRMTVAMKSSAGKPKTKHSQYPLRVVGLAFFSSASCNSIFSVSNYSSLSSTSLSTESVLLTDTGIFGLSGLYILPSVSGYNPDTPRIRFRIITVLE